MRFYTWRFKYSGMWYCIIWWKVTDVLKALWPFKNIKNCIIISQIILNIFKSHVFTLHSTFKEQKLVGKYCVCVFLWQHHTFSVWNEPYLWALLRVGSIREAYGWMRCDWASCCCVHTRNPTAITTATTGSTCDANILMWHCAGRGQIWHWWGGPVLARKHNVTTIKIKLHQNLSANGWTYYLLPISIRVSIQNIIQYQSCA
jgi:hypothetical protein